MGSMLGGERPNDLPNVLAQCVSDPSNLTVHKVDNHRHGGKARVVMPLHHILVNGHL